MHAIGSGCHQGLVICLRGFAPLRKTRLGATIMPGRSHFQGTDSPITIAFYIRPWQPLRARLICIPPTKMIETTVNHLLMPVRVVLNVCYGLLFGVTYGAIFAMLSCGKGCVKLIRGYFYLAYRWQPRNRAKARYEVTPVFDAGVTVTLLVMVGMYAYLSI